MKTLRRLIPGMKLQTEKLSSDFLNQIEVTMGDFREAFKDVMPSTMREVYVEIPDVSWSDIGGLHTIKKELQEAVEWPLKYPDIYNALGYSLPKGILLHGPSGNGKTMLAKAVAKDSEANFISVRGPELISKWVGESERGIREVFRRARQASPCVIFFDEIDSLTPIRGTGGDSMVSERIVSQLLTELDGIQNLSGVIVLAATNRPDMIDTALLRAGRFDKLLLVSHPDQEARKSILEIHLRSKPTAPDIDLEKIATQADGFSAADTVSIVNTAISNILQEFLSKYKTPEELQKHTKEMILTMSHLENSIQKVKTSREAKPIEKELKYYR